MGRRLNTVQILSLKICAVDFADVSFDFILIFPSELIRIASALSLVYRKGYKI